MEQSREGQTRPWPPEAAWGRAGPGGGSASRGSGQREASDTCRNHQARNTTELPLKAQNANSTSPPTPKKNVLAPEGPVWALVAHLHELFIPVPHLHLRPHPAYTVPRWCSQHLSCLHRASKLPLASPKPVPFRSKEYCSPGRHRVGTPTPTYSRPRPAAHYCPQGSLAGGGGTSIQGPPTHPHSLRPHSPHPMLLPALSAPKEALEDEQSASPQCTASLPWRRCSTWGSGLQPEQPRLHCQESGIFQQKPESGAQAPFHR